MPAARDPRGRGCGVAVSAVEKWPAQRRVATKKTVTERCSTEKHTAGMDFSSLLAEIWEGPVSDKDQW